jgi:hypothetical protein
VSDVRSTCDLLEPLHVNQLRGSTVGARDCCLPRLRKGRLDARVPMSTNVLVYVIGCNALYPARYNIPQLAVPSIADFLSTLKPRCRRSSRAFSLYHSSVFLMPDRSCSAVTPTPAASCLLRPAREAPKSPADSHFTHDEPLEIALRSIFDSNSHCRCRLHKGKSMRLAKHEKGPTLHSLARNPSSFTTELSHCALRL